MTYPYFISMTYFTQLGATLLIRSVPTLLPHLIEAASEYSVRTVVQTLVKQILLLAVREVCKLINYFMSNLNIAGVGILKICYIIQFFDDSIN